MSDRRVIKLDGAAWHSVDDVYEAILGALEAPEWHGRNLDAMWDSLSGDDINGMTSPYEFILLAGTGWPPDVADFVAKLQSYFHDAKASGVDIQLSIE